MKGINLNKPARLLSFFFELVAVEQKMEKMCFQSEIWTAD